jgi:hypothetical protein
MAQFCIVAPHQLCEGLKKDNLLGTAHLLLAHDVVKYATAYHNLFHTDNMWSAHRLIILDNSVVETGNAVDLGMIKEAMSIVAPTCIVLPDVYEKVHETIISCDNAYDSWSALCVKTETTLMMCPQGRTLADFVYCAERFKRYEAFPFIQWWGVPRNLVKNVGSRRDAIKILHAINSERSIHLLGFSDNMIDDVLCARLPEVASIDSAVPLRVDNFSINGSFRPRNPNWFETAEYDYARLSTNLDYVRRLVTTEK